MIVLGLLLSYAFHGLHNLLAIYSTVFGFIALIVMGALLWRLVLANIRTALEVSPFNPNQAFSDTADKGPDSLK